MAPVLRAHVLEVFEADVYTTSNEKLDQLDDPEAKEIFVRLPG